MAKQATWVFKAPFITNGCWERVLWVPSRGSDGRVWSCSAGGDRDTGVEAAPPPAHWVLTRRALSRRGGWRLPRKRRHATL